MDEGKYFSSLEKTFVKKVFKKEESQDISQDAYAKQIGKDLPTPMDRLDCIHARAGFNDEIRLGFRN